MGNTQDKVFDRISNQADAEVSTNSKHSSHLNLLELSQYFGKGVVQGAAKPIEGIVQIATGSTIGATDENQKISGADAAAEHLGQSAGEAFDYLLAMRLGKGALTAAENKFGFETAEKLGPKGALFAEKTVSISAGGMTGFLQPTQNGGFDINQRGKNAFLGATTTGLFEGSSHVLSSNGLAGSVFKDASKVFASGFVAGGASAELQSRVNFKQDASLKDILSAGAMWGVTGSALHFGGKMISAHQNKVDTEVKGDASAVEHEKTLKPADGESIFAEVPSEMVKTVAEAAAKKKRDEPSIRSNHRSS